MSKLATRRNLYAGSVPGASDEARRVKIMNAKWVTGADGGGEDVPERVRRDASGLLTGGRSFTPLRKLEMAARRGVLRAFGSAGLDLFAEPGSDLVRAAVGLTVVSGQLHPLW